MIAVATMLELLWCVATTLYTSACQAFLVVEKRQVLPDIIKKKVLEGELQDTDTSSYLNKMSEATEKRKVAASPNSGCQPSPLPKKALAGTVKSKPPVQPVNKDAGQEDVSKEPVLEGGINDRDGDLMQAEAASNTSPVIKAVVKIQVWWRDGCETRRHKQADRILGMCGVGSRLAKIFEEASSEWDELDEPMEMATETLVEKEESELIGEVIPQPVHSCLSKVFLGDGDSLPPMGLFQVAKSGSWKRAASPSGSTSAGSASESGDDSASEWMTEEAWRPPPGLGPPFRPPPGLELELPDPWEAQCF